MKAFVFLPPAQNDLVWFRTYYERVFPNGGRAASEHYLSALRTLSEHPNIGQRALDDVRRLPIKRTPFVILYRVRDRIEILRIRDQRSGRGDR